MSLPHSYLEPLFTVSAVVIVAATLVTQNTRARGPYHMREYNSYGLWEAYILRRGWPFTWHERADTWYTASLWLVPYEADRLEPVINKPAMEWTNAQSWALVGDVVLGMLMMTTTAILVEYWRRHRAGPNQFSLRALFVAAAPVALVMALIDNEITHVSAFLYPPLALASLSLPAVVGLMLQHHIRNSDRRLSGLRSRFNRPEETALPVAIPPQSAPTDTP